MATEYPVLVIGGCGCLGQHVIKMLHAYCPHVTEIRVLDVKPFEKKLEYEGRLPVTSFPADISNLSDTTMFEGVKSVIHLASVISFGNFPDYEGMERVNVRGTEQILEACIKENVDNLVYGSTVDVVCGYNDIVNGDEETTLAPDKLIYVGYAGTKLRAETSVLKANGKQLATGKVLRTMSLRPTVFYGELDSYYIPEALRQTRGRGGTLTQVGQGHNLYQHSYVGNIAWAFICAENKLHAQSESATVKEEEKVEGHAYFVTDDNPPKSMPQQLLPFLEHAGFGLSSYRVPFSLVYGSVRVAEGLAWLLSPFTKIDLGLSSSTLTYINSTFTFSNAKARCLLNYSPKFTPQEGLDLSNKYYSSLKF